MIFERLNQAGSIVRREVEQTYCEKDQMPLPDRFVRGTCPRCGAPDQYGDSCEICGATYRPTDLVDPRCAVCGTHAGLPQSEHYFFKLSDYEKPLRDLMAGGYTQKSVANKLDEWFQAGLKDWDISRDGPYFGFKIPGEENKYFYVWLDAPIGYMASAKNYCDRHGLNFDELWNSPANELYHFIGKDIMYFHALFWPAMLIGAGFKTANKLFIHGFLTVNGEKMSKSRGTFIKASTYAKHLDPEFLRYYYASKLTDAGRGHRPGHRGLHQQDQRRPGRQVRQSGVPLGSHAHPASSTAGSARSTTRAGNWSPSWPRRKSRSSETTRDSITPPSCGRSAALADDANRYVEQKQPWTTIKTDRGENADDVDGGAQCGQNTDRSISSRSCRASRRRWRSSSTSRD